MLAQDLIFELSNTIKKHKERPKIELKRVPKAQDVIQSIKNRQYQEQQLGFTINQRQHGNTDFSKTFSNTFNMRANRFSRLERAEDKQLQQLLEKGIITPKEEQVLQESTYLIRREDYKRNSMNKTQQNFEKFQNNIDKQGFNIQTHSNKIDLDKMGVKNNYLQASNFDNDLNDRVWDDQQLAESKFQQTQGKDQAELERQQKQLEEKIKLENERRKLDQERQRIQREREEQERLDQIQKDREMRRMQEEREQLKREQEQQQREREIKQQREREALEREKQKIEEEKRDIERQRKVDEQRQKEKMDRERRDLEEERERQQQIERQRQFENDVQERRERERKQQQQEEEEEESRLQRERERRIQIEKQEREDWERQIERQKREDERRRQQQEEDRQQEQRKQKEEADRRQKEREREMEMEREEDERRQRQEAERRREREEADRKQKERDEADRKQRERDEAERAERRQKDEADKRQREEAERKQKEEAERKQKEEAERKQKEEAERKQKLEAERKQKEEAERKQKEEAERKQKEEAERKQREEAEKKQREEAERLEQQRIAHNKDSSPRGDNNIFEYLDDGDSDLFHNKNMEASADPYEKQINQPKDDFFDDIEVDDILKEQSKKTNKTKSPKKIEDEYEYDFDEDEEIQNDQPQKQVVGSGFNYDIDDMDDNDIEEDIQHTITEKSNILKQDSTKQNSQKPQVQQTPQEKELYDKWELYKKEGKKLGQKQFDNFDEIYQEIQENQDNMNDEVYNNYYQQLLIGKALGKIELEEEEPEGVENPEITAQFKALQEEAVKKGYKQFPDLEQLYAYVNDPEKQDEITDEAYENYTKQLQLADKLGLIELPKEDPQQIMEELERVLEFGQQNGYEVFQPGQLNEIMDYYNKNGATMDEGEQQYYMKIIELNEQLMQSPAAGNAEAEQMLTQKIEELQAVCRQKKWKVFEDFDDLIQYFQQNQAKLPSEQIQNYQEQIQIANQLADIQGGGAEGNYIYQINLRNNLKNGKKQGKNKGFKRLMIQTKQLSFSKTIKNLQMKNNNNFTIKSYKLQNSVDQLNCDFYQKMKLFFIDFSP